MRIVVAHNAYQQPGGEDACVRAETAMLSAHGHTIIPFDVSNDTIASMSRLDAAARTVWSRPAYRELRALFRRERPDVVHFHNTFPLISPAAYYAARQEGVGVVQTLHNHRFICANAVFFRDGGVCQDCLGAVAPWRGVVRGCYRGSRAASLAVASMIGVHRLARTWNRAVDVLIALSQSSRANFVAAGFDARRIAVKPNFVYPDPGLGSARGGGGYALFVGRLSEEKGLLTLLKAWTDGRPGMPLTIVGDGPMRPAVEAAARGRPDIRLLGTQASEAVYDLMGRAEIVIVPSECLETFGRVAVEAFAKGTPVLASRLGGLEEIVRERCNGSLFEAGDPADLAVKVRLMVADPARLQRMREAARATYERHYTMTANHAQLVSLYRRAQARVPVTGAEPSLSE